MTSNWMSSRWVQLLFVMAAFGLERAVARMFGSDLWPGAGAEAGLLLLWFSAHCDTMDGPVVLLAKQALEEKNVNLVLPWVRPEDEEQIRHTFEHAQAVRGLGPQARTLADRHFLETLVRVHRAGEGAPYSGLKPAGLDLGPAVPAADRALQSGSAEALTRLLADAVTAGVQSRFEAALQKKTFEPNDVAAGRRYVDAYIAYVHYVEKVWEAASVTASPSQCGGPHRSVAAPGGHHH